MEKTGRVLKDSSSEEWANGQRPVTDRRSREGAERGRWKWASVNIGDAGRITKGVRGVRRKGASAK